MHFSTIAAVLFASTVAAQPPEIERRVFAEFYTGPDNSCQGTSIGTTDIVQQGLGQCVELAVSGIPGVPEQIRSTRFTENTLTSTRKSLLQVSDSIYGAQITFLVCVYANAGCDRFGRFLALTPNIKQDCKGQAFRSYKFINGEDCFNN